MQRPISAALTALALTAILAGPVFAAKPNVESFVTSSAFDIDCGSFLLHETYTQNVSVTTWLGPDGHPLRAQAHVAFLGTISGPGGVLTLPDESHFTEFTDFGADGDALRQVGLIYNFVVPGIGIVAHDVGAITFAADGSVEITGPHDVWDSGLESLICPLFED